MREGRSFELVVWSPAIRVPTKIGGLSSAAKWSRIGDFRGCPARGRAEGLMLSRLTIHVDLDGAWEQRAPGLQIDLHARIARDSLAVELDDLRGLVFHFVDEAGWIVHVLQQANPLPAERLIERRRRFYQRRKLRGIRRRQGEFELYGSPHRLSLFCHRSRAPARAWDRARENANNRDRSAPALAQAPARVGGPR